MTVGGQQLFEVKILVDEVVGGGGGGWWGWWGVHFDRQAGSQQRVCTMYAKPPTGARRCMTSYY